jgi:hypothetical protein
MASSSSKKLCVGSLCPTGPPQAALQVSPQSAPPEAIDHRMKTPCLPWSLQLKDHSRGVLDKSLVIGQA